MNKWYMHNPASLLENETHEILWDFQIQMDHLISARRPDSDSQQKEENLLNSWLSASGWPQSKTKGKRKEI